MNTTHRLGHFSTENFYGQAISPDLVTGLRAEVRYGRQAGIEYAYIVFFGDQHLIKWRIEPQITPNKRIAGLRLYHRNRFGTRNRFHSQHQRAWGTPRGLRELLQYIAQHELWEREDSALPAKQKGRR